MRTALVVGSLALLAACSTADSLFAPPQSTPATDTLAVPDPTRSQHPGSLHLNLVRSSSSAVPASADSALLHVYNAGSGFTEYVGAKIPAPGAATVVALSVPSDTGYTIAILAFHGATLDAVGSTSDNDTTITVFPQGNPLYTNTPVHVTMRAAPFLPSYSIGDGQHVTAGEHISFSADIATPRDIWTDVQSSWGCSFNQNVCAVYSYQGTVADAPGPWLVETTFIANWGDHTFSSSTASITLVIDPGTGGIDVTFNRHHR